ncbi:MAG: hypothetical protein FRX48_01313 [Lasallia pustulata]|uniref:Uncharacterized protein n=1 Tax=Lasallia pustulata TaxID=136370 RepID=A0A5M8Q0Q9_9LECA|nr:MAG: hypothetical protein FRX48_01313 [Lasallia pustulata]
MSATLAPEATTIHIAPDLQHLRVPLRSFLDNRPSLDCLAVGAFVFTPGAVSPTAHVASVSPIRNTYRALYDFEGTSEHEFTLKQGRLVEVTQENDSGWSLVKDIDGRRQGWSPSAYLIQESPNVSSPHTGPETRLLLVQRSSHDSSPLRWEVPGGSSDDGDPTILHSVARELFEETGLHLTRFNRQIGDGIGFETDQGRRRKQWLKLSFEVEVLEIPSTSHGHVHDQNATARLGNNSQVADQLLDSVFITLDPDEHQSFAWATEEDIKSSDPSRDVQTRGPFVLFNEEQRLLMLQAFELRRSSR